MRHKTYEKSDAWKYVRHETPEISEAQGTQDHLGYEISEGPSTWGTTVRRVPGMFGIRTCREQGTWGTERRSPQDM